MPLPREFLLMVGTAACACALVFSSALSRPDTLDLSAPLRFEILAGVEPVAEDDGPMLALRQEARAALAGLQTAAVATQ